MVKGAKGKTNDSFGSQVAREKTPLSVSVSKTHARLVSVEKVKIDPNQHETSEKQ